MNYEIEDVRKEFIALVKECGNDYKAADILNDVCFGFGPNRSTISRIRRGEAKDTMTAMATILLKKGLNKDR